MTRISPIGLRNKRNKQELLNVKEAPVLKIDKISACVAITLYRRSPVALLFSYESSRKFFILWKVE